eukprot:COSAG01_NODE_7128_length_3338_cov_1.993825_1_plen_88_part_00
MGVLSTGSDTPLHLASPARREHQPVLIGGIGWGVKEAMATTQPQVPGYPSLGPVNAPAPPNCGAFTELMCEYDVVRRRGTSGAMGCA